MVYKGLRFLIAAFLICLAVCSMILIQPILLLFGFEKFTLKM